MKTEIVKNPDELKIITNPNKSTTTMAKQTKKAFGELKEQGITAAYILGGQAIGAQVNAMVVPSVLGTQNATVQQAARAGIPATIGVLLAMSKNKHLQGLSLGFGVQGVLELIKFVMPDWSPSAGFGEGSTFVFTDENGNARRAVVTPNGEVVLPNGQKVMLPPAAGGKTSARTSDTEEDVSLEDYWDSGYIEDNEEVEWV